MLFLFLLAALSGSIGWMLFWSVLGFFFSERPSYLFLLPLAAAWNEDPRMGVGVVLCTWLFLAIKSGKEAAGRNQERLKNEALIAQAQVQVENALHQSAKPGA